MEYSAGVRLGPYEIVSLIGAGGMGEVYRARDTKLKRDVALKVLPEAFADDPERMARFQREAEVLASLNHPNIAHIYGVEDRALVMELVEGESPKGPLPFEEAWKIAAQMADALEYAHEKGIVHRDLKPANVKVTPEGVVKLLDFGLAKAFTGPAAVSTNPDNSPTLTLGATQLGVILGTAGYMAPEQAKGKAVDKRADIWSFGVVLYELLRGERLFSGEDVSDTLAQVLTQEPDLERVPAPARRLLRRCLEKDPKKRLRDIGEARYLVEEIPAAPDSIAHRRRHRLAFAAGFAAILFIIAASVAAVHFRGPVAPQRGLRLSVPLPEDTSVLYLELSPDAKRLALVLSREDKFQIYVRQLDSEELQPLAGTEGGFSPFWSPDSRFIAFTGGGKLKIIPAAGGPAQALCDSGNGGGGTWNAKGVILFSTGSGFRRVNASGGQCVPVGKNQTGVGLPIFLPDGNHFFYTRQSITNDAETGVYLASLDEPAGRKLLPDLSNVVYTPPAAPRAQAHLLFLRDGAIIAQPFDEVSMQTVGDPFPVGARGSPSLTQFMAASAAPDGTLVYLAGRSRVTQLTWFDRTGRELGKAGPRAEQGGVSLSSDGRMVAMVRTGRPLEEWVYDLARGPEIRLTPPGATPASGAVWWPDNRRVVFTMFGPEGPGIYRADFTGGPPQLLMKSTSTTARAPSSLSRDGRVLIYSDGGGIWYAPLESGRPPANGIRITDGTQGQLSPDGKWLAYSVGLQQIRIRPFPTGEGVWQIPSENAQEARWSPDGKEVYFIKGTVLGRVTLMAVKVEPDGHGGLQIGAPQRLFDMRVNRMSPQANAFSYSPSPDGRRFLVNALVDTAEPTVNVITNWQKAVGR